MSEIIITLEQLRTMIGLCLFHRGIRCQVIEVLEEDLALVLHSLEEAPMIQLTHHVMTARATTEIYTIPVLNDERSELHPVFLALDLEEA